MEPWPPEPKSSRNARQTGSVATPRAIDAPRKHKIPNLMRVPFFYGWIIVVVTFVTMAIGVNARTAFSLFFPPIIDEFGWERGVTAGALSFRFLVSGAGSPLIGRLMDRAGPRAVMELGVALMAGGALLAPRRTPAWRPVLCIGAIGGAWSDRVAST